MGSLSEERHLHLVATNTDRNSDLRSYFDLTTT